MKETDARTEELPDRPISSHRNFVTETGLAAIEASIGRFEAAHQAATDKGDAQAAAAALREIRYWRTRRASAEVVRRSSDTRTASFGMTVALRREDGREQTFRIVGEDEADPLHGTVSYVSPLARAVLTYPIDGSKFKAVNARDKNFTKAKMKRRLERIEESIERYMAQLETADRRGDAVPEAKVVRLKDKIVKLKEEVARLSTINAEMMKSEDKQISLTDQDARSMATSGKDTGIVGYNVQAAVDTRNHLIVAHEVTNVGTDRHQLSNMAEQARTEMGVETLDAVADRGYYAGEEICACEEAGITVTLPKPMTSNSKAAGRFGKQDFRYVAAEDAYVCPSGQRLAYSFTTKDKDLVLRRYRTNACQSCAIKGSCTTGKERLISRWEHEAVLETVQARLDHHPEKMTMRRQTAEHPFGTIKCWMGATHFLMKGLPRVATEMALNVLAYNMKRVMAIIGVVRLIEVSWARRYGRDCRRDGCHTGRPVELFCLEGGGERNAECLCGSTPQGPS